MRPGRIFASSPLYIRECYYSKIFYNFLRTTYVYVDIVLNSLVTHNFKTSALRNFRDFWLTNGIS